jgi:membrane protein implicated in regulation of membrane protease activity
LNWNTAKSKRVNSVDVAPILLANAAYGWWAAAAVLLVLEMALTSNWLLWPGLAAFLTGLLAFFMPEMGWETEAVIFVLAAVLLLFLGRRFVSFSATTPDIDNLNNRTARLMGRRGAALADGPDGTSRIQIDGTEWAVRRTDGGAVRVGDILQIDGMDGTILLASPPKA